MCGLTNQSLTIYTSRCGCGYLCSPSINIRTYITKPGPNTDLCSVKVNNWLKWHRSCEEFIWKCMWIHNDVSQIRSTADAFRNHFQILILNYSAQLFRQAISITYPFSDLDLNFEDTYNKDELSANAAPMLRWNMASIMFRCMIYLCNNRRVIVTWFDQNISPHFFTVNILKSSVLQSYSATCGYKKLISFTG